jgi:hypothetical protein
MPISSPSEIQDKLVEEFKSLGDKIFAEQEKYRQNKVKMLCSQMTENLKKTFMQDLNYLQTRASFANVDLGPALNQHQNQMALIQYAQEEIESILNRMEIEENELVNDYLEVKPSKLRSIEIAWQQQLKPVIKNADSCRSKRKSQMLNKLKDINGKFKSDDFMAMQAMLGRF